MAKRAVAAAGAGVRPAQAIGGVSFDWMVVLLGAWFIAALYTDGWAHAHMTVETFFTPWHAFLYAAYLAFAGLLVWTVLLNHWRGASWRVAVPPGYGVALGGAGIFLVGGVGDGIGHTIFGIEKGIEALLSPTHLLLALGGALMAMGPLRAGWKRADSSPVARWPALLALTYLLALFSYFINFPEPFTWTAATAAARAADTVGKLQEELGVTSLLLHAIILASFLVLAIRQWGARLPAGAVFVLVALPLVSLAIMEEQALSTGAGPLVVVAILAGAVAEGLYRWWQPAPDHLAALRRFMFAAPALLYALYFLALQTTGGGITWAVHLWTGAILLAGAIGWLVSYLMVPPAGQPAGGE